MLEFIFDLPLIIIGPTIVGVLGLFTVLGLRVVRRRVLPRWHIQAHDSHFTGTMVHSVIVFYGLAVALMAVNVCETYADVSKIVSGEASALAMIYRDVSSYPEPSRTQLQSELHDYVKYVIEEAWPMQRRGQVPAGGVERMNHFQAILLGFEPATEGQKLLHGETLSAFNQMIQVRRMRLEAVSTGLPAVMWFVIVAGAFIGLSGTFFFKVEDARLHGSLVLLLAVFIGMVIFMILALDRPFRGDLGLGSEPYELVYHQLMNGAP